MTRLLAAVGAGRADAAGALFPAVYDELRRLAGRRMAEERAGHTLQATALVHEAYVRLVGGVGGEGEGNAGTGAAGGAWANRAHFFFAAAEAMRRILVDHARARGVQKRGGGRRRVPLGSVLDLASDEGVEEIVSLDDAVSRLEERVSARVAAVVRLRFYAGLSTEEAAAALGVTARTVKRDWTYARAWLARELGSPDGA